MMYMLYFLLIPITECAHSSHANKLSGHTSVAEPLFPSNLSSMSQTDNYIPPQFVLIPGMEGDTRVLNPYVGGNSTTDLASDGNCSSTVAYNFTINTNTSEHQVFVTIQVNASMFFPEPEAVWSNSTSTTTTPVYSKTMSTTPTFNATSAMYNATSTAATNITVEEQVNYVQCDVIDAFAQRWQFNILDIVTVAIPSPEGVVHISPGVSCSDGNVSTLESCWTNFSTCLSPHQQVFDEKYTNIQTPKLHYTNEMVEIQANTTDINTCGAHIAFAWRILLIGDGKITSVYKRNNNNKKLTIKANQLDGGLYIVFFEIQFINSSSNGSTFDEQYMYLRMITPELVASIAGPSTMELPKYYRINLDASQSRDPASGLSSVDAIPIVTYWTLLSINSSNLNHGSDVDACIKNFPDCSMLYSSNGSLLRHYTTSSSSSYLTLDSRNIYDDILFVVFTMTRGNRKSSALQVIKILENGYLIKLICIYNCFQNRANKMSVGRIELYASISLHQSYNITFKEEVDEWSNTAGQFVPSGIAFDSVLFPEGKTLRFVITSAVTHPRRKTPKYNRVEYIRHVNYIPYGGSCSISSYSGVSSMDIFTVQCSGWMDEGNRLYQNSTEDKNPILRYMVVQKSATLPLTLAVSDEPQLKFAVMLGDPTNAYTATVVVKVMDFMGDAAEVTFNVNSLPPMDVTSVTANRHGAMAVRDYVNATTHVMDRKSTEIDHVISLVSAASSVLSAIPIPVKETDLHKSIDEVPGLLLDINLNEPANDTEHLTFKEYYQASIDRSLDPATNEIQMSVQFITERAYNVLNERVVSGEKASDQLYVTHLTECFNTLLNVREYVNDVTKNLAVNGLGILTGTSSNLWSISTTSGTEERESAETQLIDMTGSTVNVVVPNDLNQARVVYDLATAYQQIDDMVVISGKNMSDAIQAATMSSSERAFTYLTLQSQLKEDLEASKELAKSSAGSIMEITRSIMDTLELCDSCSKTIGTGDLIQSLTLLNTSKLASTPLPVRSGSLTLSGNSKNNSHTTTVSVSHFNKNIFMYDSDLTSSYVTYGVIHADTSDNDTSVDDVTYEQQVDARQKELVYPIIHEEDASKFALHKFVYRSNQDDVCLAVEPVDNSTVIGYEVYVRFSEPPTVLKYDIRNTVTAKTDWVCCITSDQMGNHVGLTYVGLQIQHGTPDMDSTSTSTTTPAVTSTTTTTTISTTATATTSATPTAAISMSIASGTMSIAGGTMSIAGGRKKRDTRNKDTKETRHVSAVYQTARSDIENASADSNKAILRTIGAKNRQSRVPASETASSAYSRMRLRRTKRSSSMPTTTVTTNVTSHGDAYYFSIVTSACLNWEESNQKWASDKCRLLWLPDENKVRCHCNNVEQLTFGTSFFLAPNSIDFSTAFLRFSPLNQAAVLGTLALVFILYVPILLWARKKDKQDIEKWGVVPLADNADYHSYVYVIQVFTGLRPGSGTDSRVAFILSGSKKDSDVKELYDGVRKRIETGSVLQFLMTTHAPLGQLTHLRIWHDNGGQGSMASWYLSKIVVYDLKERDCFTFRCENWISVDTADDILERTLAATHGEDRPVYEQRFMAQAKHRLSDSHMWASVLYRPTYSDFTRAQRATCALMYIMVNMVANAMYFNPDADYETDPALKIGPFRFGLRQLTVAFITAIITTPSTLAVSIIFRLSRRQVTVGDLTSQLKSRPGSSTELLQTKDSGSGCCQGKSRDNSDEYSVPVLYLDQQRGCFSLPWQFSILGWVLAVGAIVTSAFFVVTYSMDWGKQKSEEWITTFLLSLLQSIFLLDPFLIIGLSMCAAIVLSSVKYANFKGWNVKATVDELMDKASVSGYTADVPQPPLMSTDLDNAKIQRRTEHRWRRTLIDLIVTLLFLWILCSITYSNREDHAFYMHKTISEMMTIDEKGNDVFKNIHSTQLFYAWLNDKALPMLFPESYYNGGSLHWAMREYMEGLQYYRLGPPRLRQIRVKSEKCNIPYMDTETCYRSYADWRTDEQNYCIGWTAPSCPRYESVYNFSSDAWTFRSVDTIKSVPIFGHLAPYGSDGYFADLNINRNISVSVVDELYQMGWIDRKTRVVLLEFTVFCANVNSFVYNQFVLEFPATGGVLTSFSVIPTRVYQHVGPLGTYVFFCEIVGLIYVLVLAIQVAMGIFKNKSASLKNHWLMFDGIRLILCAAVIALYAIRHYISLTTIEKFKTNAKVFVDFHSISFWNELLMIILGFSVFLATIRILKALEGNKSIYIISTVFSKLASDLFWLTVVFFYVLVAFAVLGHLLFGSQLVSYVNINTSLSTLFVALIGKNRFSEMNETDPILAKVYFFLFTMSMSMFLFATVLSSLCQCIMEVRRSIHIQDTRDVFMYAYNQFISSFNWDLNRYRPSRNVNSVTPFQEKDAVRRFRGMNITSDEKRRQAAYDKHGMYTPLCESRGHTDENTKHKSFVGCGRHRSFVENDGRSSLDESISHPFFVESDRHTSLGENGRHTSIGEKGSHVSLGESGMRVSFVENGRHTSFSEKGKRTSFGVKGFHGDLSEKVRYVPFGGTSTHTSC